MSLLGKYLDDFLSTYGAKHEAQRERAHHAPAECSTVSPVDPQPAPARVCARCGDVTARVYLVMNGGWMLCSRCYRQ
jgi:formylmethanofuran dehydrogenase subunit E